ncbi:MAG: SOUL family heme-binding protein [Myxococcaceae bacterium]
MGSFRALGIGMTAVVALWGTHAMAIETPKYDIVRRYADFEVRSYAPIVVAETQVNGERSAVGNEAFSRLAGYIFGKNRASQKIAMTAPVTQEPEKSVRIAMTAPVNQVETSPNSWVVQFTMPSSFTLTTLPKPNDPRVTLREVPARTVAAIRYSGTWSQSNYDKHLAALRGALAREGLVAGSEPIWARYDPPYKPWFMRTNEILIEVQTPRGP